MIALVLSIVLLLVLVARTRFWWLPGTIVAMCAIPVIGFILGGTRDGIGDELFSVGSAMLWGGLVAGFGLALGVVGGLMNYLFQRRGTPVVSRRVQSSSQLL